MTLGGKVFMTLLFLAGTGILVLSMTLKFKDPIEVGAQIVDGEELLPSLDEKQVDKMMNRASGAAKTTLMEEVVDESLQEEAKKHLLDISYWDQMLTVQGGAKKAAAGKPETAEEEMNQLKSDLKITTHAPTDLVREFIHAGGRKSDEAAAVEEAVAGLDVDKAVAIAGGPEMFCAVREW
jgi:hypothetical protein